MERSYSPEKMDEVRRHVEGSTLTYPEIATLTGVSASTISRWKCRHKWKRPDGAFGRKPMPKDQRAAAERAMADGARYQEVAIMVGRSCDVVRQWRRAALAAVPAGAPGGRDGADPPGLVAELWDALTDRGIGRDDVLRQAPRIYGLILAQLASGDPGAPRRAEALARTAVSFTKVPDPSGPALGASHDDPYAGPQSFDETNALLEELALRLGEWDAERAHGIPGAPVSSPAAAGP
jgi:transposase